MKESGLSPTPVDKTPDQRRRFLPDHFLPGNFLHSWLDRRDDEEKKGDSGNKKKKTKKRSADTDDKTETSSKPERFRDRFKNLLKGLVSLETVPAGATESPAENPVSSSFGQFESLDSEPDPAEESTSEAPAAEGGVLAVSAQAQRQRYGYELPAEDTETGPEALPEIEVDKLETDEPTEQDYGPDRLAASAATGAAQSSGSAEQAGDIIRRRQEERLQRRVKKLRWQSRNTRHQQADMKERQDKFERQLEDNQKAQQKFQNEIVPKMEADRKKLRQRLEKEAEPPKIKYEIPAASAIITEKANQKVTIKSETIAAPETSPEAVPVPEKIEKTIKIEHTPPVVEEKFEDDGYRETYYERRHEVKDEPTPARSPVSSFISGTSPPRGVLEPPPAYSPASYQIQTTQTGKSTWSSVYRRISPKPGPDMYKQSALNGAIGGIIILVLLGLLTLVR